MKQGKQVQVRSELVRCEFILVVCKENDSPVNRIRHLLDLCSGYVMFPLQIPLDFGQKYANIGTRREACLEHFPIPSDPSRKAWATLEHIQIEMIIFWAGPWKSLFINAPLNLHRFGRFRS